MTPQRLMKRKFWRKREVGRVKALHPQTGAEIYVNPQRDALISEDLDLELRRLPGVLSWYMALRAKAKTALKNAQHAHVKHSKPPGLRINLLSRWIFYANGFHDPVNGVAVAYRLKGAFHGRLPRSRKRHRPHALRRVCAGHEPR